MEPINTSKSRDHIYIINMLIAVLSRRESIKKRMVGFKKVKKNYVRARSLCKPTLRVLTGKKQRQIKFQRLQKIWIWAFGSLVPQINFLLKVPKPKQNFRKNKVVTGKTPFFLIGPFCTHHSICFNTGFRHGSFVWKWCVSSLGAFN